MVKPAPTPEYMARLDRIMKRNIGDLVLEIAQLQAENEELHDENGALRRTLADLVAKDPSAEHVKE